MTSKNKALNKKRNPFEGGPNGYYPASGSRSALTSKESEALTKMKHHRQITGERELKEHREKRASYTTKNDPVHQAWLKKQNEKRLSMPHYGK